VQHDLLLVMQLTKHWQGDNARAGFENTFLTYRTRCVRVETCCRDDMQKFTEPGTFLYTCVAAEKVHTESDQEIPTRIAHMCVRHTWIGRG
jgi:hypothetical protein